MLQRILTVILKQRHFWRYATFDEVAELYVSRTARIFAFRMVAMFAAIYLLQEGFSVLFIALFFAALYIYKAFFAYPSAYLIAANGPKHATLVSNVLAAVGLVFLPFVPAYGMYAVVLWGIFNASSQCLYDFAYMVDFSKVKHVRHAGKELAFMNMLEKVATSVSPLVGGLLAFWAGPELVMVVAVVLLLLAALPLFTTAEPIKVHQQLTLRHFPWRTTWRSLVAEAAVGVDIFVSGTAWVIFMAVAIFSTSSDAVYAQVGAVSSVAIVAALVASYMFGKLIDRRRGRELLRYSTACNSLIHLLRILITTPTGVVMANIMNETTTTGYTMAFTKGMFDMADTTGRRIAYLLLIEICVNVGLALAALGFAGIILLVHDATLALQVLFVLAAVVTLLIATPRFLLYRR